MSSYLSALWQFGIFFWLVVLLTKPLGLYMAGVYSGKLSFLSKGESWIYRLMGIDPAEEMEWKHYALSLLYFSLGGFLLLYAILRMQHMLPFNPQQLPDVAPALAFNTAVSFMTNSSWQSYGGETTLSNFSQMMGITVQSFLSGAVGMAVLVALIRGLVRRQEGVIGNFWVDIVRGGLYILLPLSLVLAIVIGSQGAIETLHPTLTVPGLENGTQQIAVGPVASQVAIKQLGSDGGGFFNTSGAHPFENPTPLSNFLEMLALILIPSALCLTFGEMAGDRRQGWAIWSAMMLILLPMVLFCMWAEMQGNPHFLHLLLDQSAGNMEGKETRFGAAASAMWTAVTTGSGDGANNSMFDSMTPLGGMVPMLLMQMGEVVFGGVGSGLYGMLVFVIIAVFIAGLMVGRTPEYLGKKIQPFEIKMASIAILVTPMAVLFCTAIAVMTAPGQAGAFNPGAQGFSEILYAFTSAGNNNGSAFAGLYANTMFYNTALAICMLVGRFFIIIPVLAIAGSFSRGNIAPKSIGTLPTHTPLFVMVLVGTVILVGVLTYIPAVALGPVAEHFQAIH